MQLNYASQEEFLQKFLDSVDLKQIKARKPHQNYVDMQDEKMRAVKCLVVAKVTKIDVLVNFVFDKDASRSIYDNVVANHKAAVDNSMSGFGEVTWINNEGKNPYIQVRRLLDDFSKEEEIFTWYRNAAFAFYECVPFEDKCVALSDSAELKTKPASQAEEPKVKEQPKAVAATNANSRYVDLGLPSGTLWATYDVGANAIGETGKVFMWGSIEEDDSSNEEFCTPEGYKFCVEKDDDTYYTKYCLDADEGDKDGKRKLDKCDDVAIALWGDEWRIPTAKELEELYEECETRIEGDFVVFVGPNNNQLVFPMCKEDEEDDLPHEEYQSTWWSSELDTDMGTEYASVLSIDGVGECDFSSLERYCSSFVRPVRVEKNKRSALKSSLNIESESEEESFASELKSMMGDMKSVLKEMRDDLKDEEDLIKGAKDEVRSAWKESRKELKDEWNSARKSISSELKSGKSGCMPLLLLLIVCTVSLVGGAISYFI